MWRFLKGVVECSKSEDCIKMIAVVSVGWTVVATSVVGVAIQSTGLKNRVVVRKAQ